MSSFLWAFRAWQREQWPRRAGLDNFILIHPRLHRPEPPARTSRGPRITCLWAGDRYRFKVCGTKSFGPSVQGKVRSWIMGLKPGIGSWVEKCKCSLVWSESKAWLFTAGQSGLWRGWGRRAQTSCFVWFPHFLLELYFPWQGCHPWDRSQTHPDNESRATLWLSWVSLKPSSEPEQWPSGLSPPSCLPGAEKGVAWASEVGPVLETWENFGGRDSENQKSVRAEFGRHFVQQKTLFRGLNFLF